MSKEFTEKKIETRKTRPGLVEKRWVENGVFFIKITSGNFTITLRESGYAREIVFKNPKGNFSTREFQGKVHELTYGDEKIREDFEKAKKVIQDEFFLAK